MELIRQARYPQSPEEWDKWRSEITRLYLEENRTLLQVMEYMVKEHQFKATYVQ